MKNGLFKILFALIILVGSIYTLKAQDEGMTLAPAGDTFCVGEEITLTSHSSYLAGDETYWEMDSINGTRTYYVGIDNQDDQPHNFYIPTVPPGKYEIFIYDTNFLFGGVTTAAWSRTFYVQPAASSTITPSGPTTFCSGGSVTLFNSGSSGTYQWFLNGDTLAGDTASSYYATQPGNYSLKLTNACGTITATAVTVTVDSTPTANISAGGPTTFCQGDSVILSTTSASAYQWSNGATTQNITITQSGDYSVSIDNGGNCSAVATGTVVTVRPAPNAAITPSGSVAFCSGDSVTLSVNTEASYLWSNHATTSSITINQAGSYTVQVTDTNGCKATSIPAVVTVHTPTTPTINPAGATTFCRGDSVTLTASTGALYLWSNSATTASVSITQNGNYTVQVTDSNGCSAVSAPTTITVNSLPAAIITPGGPTAFCIGDSVTLSANTESSYLWSNGATAQIITVKQAGNYTVVVTGANNCSGTSSPLTVSTDTLPYADVTTSGDTVFCAGNSISLTASPATLYLWNTGATTQSINASTTGSYWVSVTNVNNCSALSNTISINVNPLPQASITPASVSFCVGGNATLTASGGVSYTWSNGGNTNATIVTSDTTITYTVTVTGANGCVDSASRKVTVNPLPDTNISPSGPVTVCQGDSAMLSAPVGNPGYLWSNNATTQTIYAAFTGNYQVTVTSVNNCSAASNTVSVTVNPLPAAPTISRDNDTLTSTIASAYQWYLDAGAISNATGRSLVITENGSYTIQITDSNGCQSTSTVLNVTALSIDNISAGYAVQLYPNPSNGNFTLRFSDAQPRIVALLDLTGRWVSVQQVNLQKDFDCTSLKSGMYLVEIKDESGVKTLSLVITN